MLSDRQKAALLQLARDAIQASLRGEPEVTPPATPEPGLAGMQAGVFISLHVGGELRGCIGSIEHTRPLLDSVCAMAVAAACNDPRFEPLRLEELPDTRIEISVLTPLQALRNLQDLQIGKHGVMIRLGKRHGLLLPQVAAQRGWDAGTFVRHVCRKAGLPEDAWQDPKAELLYFSAEVFSDQP